MLGPRFTVSLWIGMLVEAKKAGLDLLRTSIELELDESPEQDRNNVQDLVDQRRPRRL